MNEFDKEKAIEDIVNGLNVERDKIVYTNLLDKFQIGDYSVFHLFQINESCISITDATIFQKYNLHFFACEIPYLRLDFFENFIKFQSCVFKIDFTIRRSSGNILIEDSIFKGHFNISRIEEEKCKIHINGNTFKEVSIFYNKCFNFNFENNSIQGITVNENLFKNAYFNYNIFEECVFYKNSFEKLSFYGSIFKKSFKFFQNTIRDSLNIVNVRLDFTFNNLQKIINANNQTKFLEQNANDFRDSFRNFKSALIKDNNLLEASNFHKYELYCKEIELKNKKGKTLKDIVDKWQLFFYRKLCDHHTDLLKVFHNLLIIIMLFSVFSFVLDKFKQPSIENNAKYHIIQVDTNESYIFKEHNKTTYNFLSLNIEQEFKNLDSLLSKTEIYFSLGFVLLVIFVALLNKQYLWFLLLPLFVGVVYYIGFPVSIITHFMIIMLFACTFVFIMVFDSKPERFLFVSVSYIVCIFALLAKPSLMLPVFGSFLEKDTNATYPLLLSLSVVYFILVALVIFSLQKTARKNSIVPS
ncbi:pentapeptide repeat-containing protein [Campylobacter sp. LMG 17559]|uniref:pentapeptide repeat-containing protein n=1 Tax=Campylobacter sp. LMG 17559 TaxID=2735748 RepID=UPI00301E29AD|nr:pentapeptide repeat-containing protein [Campylobacter sp. LMG 17559]